MKTKHLPLFRIIGFILIAFLFLISCQKENANNINLLEKSENLISMDDASAIAKRFLSNKIATSSPGKLSLISSIKKQNQNKQIASIVSVPDDAGTAAFYVINYEGGGFLILSGDKRVEPILAWSEMNSFPLENVEEFPSGLVQWLYSSKEVVQYARSANLQATEAVNNQWRSVINDTIIYAPNGNHPPLPETGDGCEDMEHIVTIKGPLLTTQWNQGCGYNEVFPIKSCSPILPCGKAGQDA